MFCGALVHQQIQMTILAAVIPLQGVVDCSWTVVLVFLHKSSGTLEMEGILMFFKEIFLRSSE